MKAPKTTNKDPLNIRKIAIYGAVLWTIFMSAVLILDIKLIKQETLNRAYTYSKVGFDKDVIYRQWVSERGGVYLKSDSLTPPNPYLSHITDRDISIDSNVFFTLVNPAYMTRMVYELQEASTDVRGHITSLNCLRPENAPDLWEIEALKAFEVGEPEYSGIDSLDGKEYFRYMKPFFVENSCLKCHAKQGYQVGDIRGGISVSYPMDQVYLLSEGDSHYHNTLHLILWLLGLGVIIIAYHQIKKSDNKRLIAEAELQNLNNELEEKVEIRTKEVLKSEQLFKELIKSAPDAIIQVNQQGHILLVNQQVSELFGYNDDELIGEAIEKLVPFNLREVHRENRKKYEKQPTTKSMAGKFEVQAQRKDGSQFDVEISLSSVQNEEDFVVTAIIRDISESKKAERKLTESEKKLDLIFETIPFAINLIDQKGVIIDCNSSLLKLHGYNKKEELIGQHSSVLFPEHEIERTKEDITAVVTEGTMHMLKYDLKRKDGTIFPAEISSSYFVDELKKEMYLVSAAFDLTERIEMELQFQTLIEQAGDAFYLSDFEGDILEVNNEAIKEIGYSREELHKMKVWELDSVWVDPNNLKAFWETMKLNVPLTFESVHKRKDGSNFPIELRATLIEVKGKKAVMGFARNIDDRKKVEIELKEYRDNLETLVKNRTKEIEEKNEALERINKLFIGRELRMKELKEEIEKLKKE